LKIIILGAGQVGANLAQSLAAENNDITVIDLDASRLALLQDRFDLRAVRGHAAHCRTALTCVPCGATPRILPC